MKKFKSIIKQECFLIETEDGNYTRYSSKNWTISIGEIERKVFDSLELENEFQKIKNTVNINLHKRYDIKFLKEQSKKRLKLKVGQKVLVRHNDKGYWKLDFYENVCTNISANYECFGGGYNQVIPLKGNEHLHKTNNHE